jgi:CubicO group peptidase (beta-lactamase class C family)
VTADDLDVPGAVRLVRGDEVVVDRVFGWADVAQRRPVTASTRFQIASVSKSFTAAAVVVAASRGLVDLDADVRRWFGRPRTSAWAGIRVHHLLTHTSGLRHWWSGDEGPDLTAAIDEGDLVAQIARTAPLFPAGSDWSYSSPGYVLLAMIVERAADRPYREVLADWVLAPAGLGSTFAGNAGDRPDVACGYAEDGATPAPSVDLDTVVMGAGDVWSTTADLVAWCEALDEPGRVVDQPWWQMLATPHVPVSRTDTGYGYGWFVGPLAGFPAVYHSGDNDGFRAFCGWDVHERVRVVVLSNRDGVDAEAEAVRLLAR